MGRGAAARPADAINARAMAGDDFYSKFPRWPSEFYPLPGSSVFAARFLPTFARRILICIRFSRSYWLGACVTWGFSGGKGTEMARVVAGRIVVTNLQVAEY